ncbi:MAG: group III truncated hemoglobin [Gammaproteobacteria bacterium]|nr:group III truncated hemoglobin [Gammaproteobacteria bacterium]
MSWLTDQLGLNDVHRVIQKFYLKARQHAVIAHHFEAIDDFSSHEEKITAFWWLALGGNLADLPHGAAAIDMINKHMALGITENDLNIWLSLFEQTLAEEITPELASAWQTKLHGIASHVKALLIEGKPGGIQIKDSLKS